eukprot:1192009-Prorocentrum_minimum.AAC.3
MPEHLSNLQARLRGAVAHLKTGLVERDTEVHAALCLAPQWPPSRPLFLPLSRPQFCSVPPIHLCFAHCITLVTPIDSLFSLVDSDSFVRSNWLVACAPRPGATGPAGDNLRRASAAAGPSRNGQVRAQQASRLPRPGSNPTNPFSKGQRVTTKANRVRVESIYPEWEPIARGQRAYTTRPASDIRDTPEPPPRISTRDLNSLTTRGAEPAPASLSARRSERNEYVSLGDTVRTVRTRLTRATLVAGELL